MSEPEFVVPGPVRRTPRSDQEEIIRRTLQTSGLTPEAIQAKLPGMLARLRSNPMEQVPVTAPREARVASKHVTVKSVDGRLYGLRRWKSTLNPNQMSRLEAELLASIELAHLNIAALTMAVRELALGGNPIAVLRAYGLRVTPLMTKLPNGAVVTEGITLIDSDSEEEMGVQARYELGELQQPPVVPFAAQAQPEPEAEPLEVVIDDTRALAELAAEFGVQGSVTDPVGDGPTEGAIDSAIDALLNASAEDEGDSAGADR
jgi:hypothetical protein